PELLLDVVADELAHLLGGGHVLAGAELLEGGLLTGVDQQGEAGGAMFGGHGRLPVSSALGCVRRGGDPAGHRRQGRRGPAATRALPRSLSVKRVKFSTNMAARWRAFSSHCAGSA